MNELTPVQVECKSDDLRTGHVISSLSSGACETPAAHIQYFTQTMCQRLELPKLNVMLSTYDVHSAVANTRHWLICGTTVCLYPVVLIMY